MKRVIALGLSLLLLVSTVSAQGLPKLYINGSESRSVSHVEDGVTYVALRAAVKALDEHAQVTWETDHAVVRSAELYLSALPGQQWLISNGRYFYIPGGVQLEDGKTLVPVRALAKAFGAQVTWEAETGSIQVESSGEPPASPYDEESLYWLSRIISAESQGESLQGQIAVGNVVLNRIASEYFPDTIYGVIFDERWGGQFEPVRNGTVYQEPTAQSVTAAKLCLNGANTAGSSLYFLDPLKAGNLWTVENRTYLLSIGVHDFYE